jgi:hypothetical protein
MGLFNFLKKKEFAEIKYLQEQLQKFAPIIDIDNEIKKKRHELEDLISHKTSEMEQLVQEKIDEIAQKETELQNLVVLKEKELNSTIENKTQAIKNIQDELDNLNDSYQSALELYTRLRKDINLFEAKLDLIEFGIYEPVYDFEKSEDYREEQNRIIEMQKSMLLSETAAICRTTWTIDGSEAKGRASTKRYIKLALRAFNGECNALISKVKWNNINQIKERIQKSHETINKLGESQTVEITYEYLDLKLKEIILEHEYQVKKQNERESNAGDSRRIARRGKSPSRI